MGGHNLNLHYFLFPPIFCLLAIRECLLWLEWRLKGLTPPASKASVVNEPLNIFWSAVNRLGPLLMLFPRLRLSTCYTWLKLASSWLTPMVWSRKFLKEQERKQFLFKKVVLPNITSKVPNTSAEIKRKKIVVIPSASMISFYVDLKYLYLVIITL